MLSNNALHCALECAATVSGRTLPAANLVYKVLQGSRPADLSVELPTRFELVVNLVAAQTLGLAIPPSILTLAGEVIK